MTTEGSTPTAGVELPLALAVDAALEVLVPVVDPRQIRLWQFGDDDCLTTMLKLQRLEAATAAAKLQLLGAMEERQVTHHATQLSTAMWLNGTTASSLNAAHREMGLAKGLHKRFPRIVAAMGRGAVSPEQASAIVGVLKKLPESLSTEQVQAAEKTMIGFAQTYGPKGLRDLAQHLLEVIAPEIAEAAEGARLEEQDKAARKNQHFRIRDDGDGTTTITGKLPAADGEALRTVIEAIANSAKAPESDANWAEGQPSYEARRAQALMTLVHSYQAGGQGPRHGGDRPRVTVLLNWQDLLRGVRGASSSAPASASVPPKHGCWPATPTSSPPSWAATPSSWIWVAPPAWLRVTSGKPSPCEIADACSPAAPANPETATPTTSNPGPPAARPAWTTPPWSARRTTGSSNPTRTPIAGPNTNAGT
jgi:hypothetical protein